MSPGYPCCCAEAPSSCDNPCICSVFDNSDAPCCITITIAGVVEGTCGDCDNLNTIYNLSQVEENGCVWKCENLTPPSCDPTNIILTAYQDGSNYKIKVELGSHVWEKNYSTTKPTCDGIDGETLSHQTNSGDCDSSSATCTLGTKTIENCFCVGDCPCNNCSENKPPCCLIVTLSGITDGTCSFCDITMNRSFACYYTSNCTWVGSIPDCCDDCEDTITVTLTESSGDYILTVTVGDDIWEVNLGTSKPDCSNWSDLNVPIDTSGSGCTTGSSSCTVSASNNCTPTPIGDSSCDDMPNWLQGVPESMEVVIGGISKKAGHPSSCSTCTVMNDTFVLDFIDHPSFACRWEYDFYGCNDADPEIGSCNPFCRISLSNTFTNSGSCITSWRWTFGATLWSGYDIIWSTTPTDPADHVCNRFIKSGDVIFDGVLEGDFSHWDCVGFNCDPSFDPCEFNLKITAL